MCVRVYVCEWTRVCVCVHVHACICVCVSTLACMRACVRVCMCVYASMFGVCVYVLRVCEFCMCLHMEDITIVISKASQAIITRWR